MARLCPSLAGCGSVPHVQPHFSHNPAQAKRIRFLSSNQRVPWLPAVVLLAATGCVSSSALELYRASDAPCYDRSLEPLTAIEIPFA